MSDNDEIDAVYDPDGNGWDGYEIWFSETGPRIRMTGTDYAVLRNTAAAEMDG